MVTIDDLREILEQFTRPQIPDKIHEYLEENTTLKELNQLGKKYMSFPAYSDEAALCDKFFNGLYYYSKEENDPSHLLNHILEQIDEFRVENPAIV